MTLPPRRHKNSGKVNLGRRFTSHRQWIRGHECAVQGDGCDGGIQAAHVEGSGTGGTGMKADDVFVIPLCVAHHAERHRGWQTFEAKYRFDGLALSKALAAKSPHIQRAAREAGYRVEDAAE